MDSDCICWALSSAPRTLSGKEHQEQRYDYKLISPTNEKNSIYSLQGFPHQPPFKQKILEYFSEKGFPYVLALNCSRPRDHRTPRGRHHASFIFFFFITTEPAPVYLLNKCMLNWIQGASWVTAVLCRNNSIPSINFPHYKADLDYAGFLWVWV